MSLKSIKNAITTKVGRQILVTQKNSPAILFGAGMVGVIATAVLASRATLKLETVLTEAEKKSEKFLSKNGEIREDQEKVAVIARTSAAIEIVKLYAPAAAVGVLTVGALAGSHVLLSRRNVALTAAYAALDKGFKEYRARVVEELGTEKDEEFRFGVVEREIAVETDEGVAIKTIKGSERGDGHSIYAQIFDEGNRNWKPQHMYNQLFINCQRQHANDLLNGRGHIFLNEVYDMLGFERTKAGAVVGWVKGNGDDYIDFGLVDDYEGVRFVKGDERSVWLDFNVDGVVYDLLGD